MTVDPFSDILKLANAQSVVSGGFTAGGSWAIRFPAFDKLKFSALVRGNCWLTVDGQEEPVRVEAGDVFLLSDQRSFVLASDLAAVPVEAASVFSPNVSKVANLGGGDDCLQIGGFVRLDPASGGFLADVLPPLIHVQRCFAAGWDFAMASWSTCSRTGSRTSRSQSCFVATCPAYLRAHIACAPGRIR